MSKIKLVPRAETDGRFWQIWLDGQDVSAFVNRVSIELPAGDLPVVTLTFVPSEIELPPDLEALVIGKRQEDLGPEVEQ